VRKRSHGASIPHAEKTTDDTESNSSRFVALAASYERNKALIAIKLFFNSFGQNVTT
jgi:hypothetical protein